MARHFRVYQPRRLLFSDGQQTLGVALPWAMAAAMVRPGTQVVSVSGDGGFLFSAQELETATRLGLSFTHVIMRDNAYDMVAFQEQLKYGRTSGVQLGDYDIAHYAAAFGAKGIRVSGMTEFEDAFKQSLTESGVTIIDVARRLQPQHRTFRGAARRRLRIARRCTPKPRARMFARRHAADCVHLRTLRGIRCYALKSKYKPVKV